MTDIQTAYLLCFALLVLLAIRVPIGVALIGVSYVGLGTVIGWQAAWGTLGFLPFSFAANWVMASIPAFLFMGFLAFHLNLTQGLFAAAKAWLSWLPGGMAVASILGCAGFASVSGSSIACSAAMGKIAVPEMTNQGYSAQLATGSVAAGGTIGALIPPSIILILYGIFAEVPIGKLFVGGAVIGLLSALFYAIAIVITVSLNPKLAPASAVRPTMSEKLAALREVLPVLLVAISVYGGLAMGIFTPTEAGAIGTVMVMAAGLLRGTLTRSAIWKSASETLTATGSLILIGIGASLFTRFLALSGVTDQMSAIVIAVGGNEIMVMVVIILIYLVLGMFLEPIGAMLLTLPIMVPVVLEYGYSPLWFGIFVAKMLEIGLITPPIGMNVFVIKGVVGNLIDLAGIFRGVLVFIIADLVLVGLMVAFPQIVTAFM